MEEATEGGAQSWPCLLPTEQHAGLGLGPGGGLLLEAGLAAVSAAERGEGGSKGRRGQQATWSFL